MSRYHLGVALGAATFALLVVFQLISSFGFPNITFLNFHHIDFSGPGSNHQIPLSPDDSKENPSEDGSVYLLGVGKADITGYFSRMSYGNGFD